MATKISWAGVIYPDNSIQGTAAFPPSRNRVINGACVAAQRTTGLSITAGAGSVYAVDRFAGYSTSLSGCAIGQVDVAVASLPYLNGILKAARFNNNSSANSPAVADINAIMYSVEGYHWADMLWGGSSAKPVSVSFYARADVAGTYSVSFGNNAARSYLASYTLPPNTWTLVTIPLPGDSNSGYSSPSNYLTTAAGLHITFDMGSGSNFETSTPNTWQGSTYYRRLAGTTKVVSTANATFDITGLQIELGTTFTPFEYVHYDETLKRCLRYYEEMGADSAGDILVGGIATAAGQQAYQTLGYKAAKRIAPAAIAAGTWTTSNATSFAISSPGISALRLAVTSVAAGNFYCNNVGAGTKITLSAEF